MNKILNMMLNTFQYVWLVHWMTRAGAKTGVHETLDSLYNEIKDFIDEYAETNLSNNHPNTDLLPVHVDITEIQDNPVDEVVVRLRALRQTFIDEKDPVLSDLSGRIVARMSHYIFMLNTNEPTYQLFSKRDEDDLVRELKSLFKNQDEFLSLFNSYLKGYTPKNSRMMKLFKENEEKLYDLSNKILESNLELFSLKESLEDAPIEAKKDYNNLVKFFDLWSE